MTASESAGSVNYGRLARDTATARRLPRDERAVLQALSLRANRSGRCWPSVGLIAEDAGYGVSSTKRALAALEAKKLIRSQRRGCQSAVRQLCLDAPLPAPPCPCGTPSMFDDDELQPAVSDLFEASAPPAPAATVEVSFDAVEVSPRPPRSSHRKRNNNPPYPPASGGRSVCCAASGDLPPVRPTGARGRDLAAFTRQMEAWAALHFPGADPRAVGGAVSWCQSRSDKRVSLDDLLRLGASSDVWGAQLGLVGSAS